MIFVTPASSLRRRPQRPTNLPHDSHRAGHRVNPAIVSVRADVCTPAADARTGTYHVLRGSDGVTPAPVVTAQRFSTSDNATTSPRCCTTRACPTCLDIAQRHHVRLYLPSTSAPRPLVAAYPATSASASAPVLGGLPAVAQSFEVTTSVPAPFSGHTATTCMHPFGAYETPCTVRQLTPHPTRTVLTTTEHVHARYRRVCHTMPCDRPPRPSTKAQRCVHRASYVLTVHGAIDAAFPHVYDTTARTQLVIITPTNAAAEAINHAYVDRLPGGRLVVNASQKLDIYDDAEIVTGRRSYPQRHRVTWCAQVTPSAQDRYDTRTPPVVHDIARKIVFCTRRQTTTHPTPPVSIHPINC